MPNNDWFEYKGAEFDIIGGRYYRATDYNGSRPIWEKISKNTYNSYRKKAFGVKSSRYSYKLPDKYKKLLYHKSEWKNNPWNNGKRLKASLQPLAVNSKIPDYKRITGDNFRTSSKWGMKISQGKGSSASVLNGIPELLLHLKIAKYKFAVQAEHFRITVGQRALKIIELSFKYHKFYNEDTPWQSLAPFTKKKRLWRNTWKGDHKSILFEYGALSRAFETTNVGSMTRIVNNRKASHGRRAKGANAYLAGIHNEGAPKGMKWGKAIPRRQFMGWTNSNSMDKIDTFALSIADRYLFDSVFLSKAPGK